MTGVTTTTIPIHTFRHGTVAIFRDNANVHQVILYHPTCDELSRVQLRGVYSPGQFLDMILVLTEHTNWLRH